MNRWTSALAALALSPLMACGAMAEDTPADVERQLWDSWAAGDAETYASLIDDPAILVAGNVFVSGKDEVVAYATETTCTDRSYEIFDLETVDLSADTAAVLFDITYTQTCPGAEGEEAFTTAVEAFVTSIYAKREGGWRNVLVNETFFGASDPNAPVEDEDTADADDASEAAALEPTEEALTDADLAPSELTR